MEMTTDKEMKRTLLAAVGSRHSVRQYDGRALTEAHRATLMAAIEEQNRASGLHIQLVVDEPEAFGRSLLAHYGKFSGVANYLCLVGPRDADEAVGYCGEVLVLLAQSLGVGSCWVALTYRKGRTGCEVRPGEKLYAVISLGYGLNAGKAHPSKAAKVICADYEAMPEWFRAGVDCALLAPTAINQQKFRFALAGDGTVRATTAWGPYSRIDLGIAKLHFELGAAPHSVKWS